MPESPASADLEVDLLHAQLADFPDLSRFESLLADDERVRAGAYRIREPRDAFVLTRGLLRSELGRRMNLEPHEVHFDLRPSGKPDVRPDGRARGDWRFSVSHTGPHVALAFVHGVDIGIDIERLDRAVQPLDIAKRYFTPREYQALTATRAEERASAFCAAWTRKEAIVKARGQTMAESLATLRVDLDPASTRPGYEDLGGAPRPHCELIAFTLAERNLIGAVALRSECRPRLRIDVLSGSRFD